MSYQFFEHRSNDSIAGWLEKWRIWTDAQYQEDIKVRDSTLLYQAKNIKPLQVPTYTPPCLTYQEMCDTYGYEETQSYIRGNQS